MVRFRVIENTQNIYLLILLREKRICIWCWQLNSEYNYLSECSAPIDIKHKFIPTSCWKNLIFKWVQLSKSAGRTLDNLAWSNTEILRWKMIMLISPRYVPEVIIWTNYGLVIWRHVASLGHNELMQYLVLRNFQNNHALYDITYGKDIGDGQKTCTWRNMKHRIYLRI